MTMTANASTKDWVRESGPVWIATQVQSYVSVAALGRPFRATLFGLSVLDSDQKAEEPVRDRIAVCAEAQLRAESEIWDLLSDEALTNFERRL